MLSTRYAAGALVCALLIQLSCIAPLAAQGVPHMRTRVLGSMIDKEVEDYLDRGGKTIIIPVGNTETHGAMPLDVEYVLPMAYAIKMAEQIDALVLPHIAYNYPGVTTVGRGTVRSDPTHMSAYLKHLCYSLDRQGFHYFLFVSNHAPAYNSVDPTLREFFDETLDPTINVSGSVRKGSDVVQAAGGKTDKIMFGAYKVVGVLDEIPLGVMGKSEPQPDFIKNINNLVGGSNPAGIVIRNPEEHAWYPDKPLTAADRTAFADEGEVQLDAVVKAMRVPEIMAQLVAIDIEAQKVVKRYPQVKIPREDR